MRFVISVAIALLHCTNAFRTDPWYDQIYYFGAPSWNLNHPLTLVGDYTFRIENLTLSQNNEFMFVSKATLRDGKPPPLGDKNWKQGKIGVGALIDSSYDKAINKSTHTMKLYPGGGGGRIPNTGIYNLTLFLTGHPTTPNVIILESYDTYPFCRLYGDKFVQDTGIVSKNTGVKVNIDCSDETLLPDFVYDFKISNGRLVNVSVDKRSIFVSWLNQGLVEIELKSGNSLFTGSKWSFLATRNVDGATNSRWGPLVKLRDNSNAFPNVLNNDMEENGWYVTPIHANVVGLTGRTIISGWLRRDDMPCRGGVMSGGRRRAAISFNVDPTKMFPTDATTAKGNVHDRVITVNVDRIEENSQCTFEDGPTGFRKQPYCKEDGQLVDGDSIYCAGHTTLEDGRIFYIGGARYAFLSQDREHEWGLDYGRLYDPKINSFTSILDHTMPLGRSWYPTASRLADGRVLVTGAFTDYSTAKCLGVSCYNPQINIFDIRKFDEGKNPWSVLIDKDHGQPDINPGIREYTRVFVLPEPQIGPDGIARDVLLSGKAGRIWLLSTDENVPMKNRFYKPPNGQRDPNGCFWDPTGSSDQSTAVHLNTRGGELFIMGGCTSNRTTLQEIDIYNVKTDSWKKIDTGIRRGVPASILLPNGKVLILSGEDKEIDQNYFNESLDAPGDPRFPQIFDPETYELTTIDNRENVYRGYHNMAALMPDGSVMLGGGFNQFGDVGCENPNLRLFFPPYLHDLSTRPVLKYDQNWPADKPLTFFPGQNAVRLLYSGSIRLHETKGVALLAVQAFTHSYGQNHRYVRMTNIKERDIGDGLKEVTFNVPTVPIILVGHYHLFLLSRDGVPSVGKHTIIGRREKRVEGNVDLHGALTATAIVIISIGTLCGCVALLACFFACLKTGIFTNRRNINNHLVDNKVGKNDERSWNMNPVRASALKAHNVNKV